MISYFKPIADQIFKDIEDIYFKVAKNQENNK